MDAGCENDGSEAGVALAVGMETAGTMRLGAATRAGGGGEKEVVPTVASEPAVASEGRYGGENRIDAGCENDGFEAGVTLAVGMETAGTMGLGAATRAGGGGEQQMVPAVAAHGGGMQGG